MKTQSIVLSSAIIAGALLSGCAHYEAQKTAGKTFLDCDACPEMVVVLEGTFMMGSNSDAAYFDEKLVHKVTIPYRFAVGKYEVTFREWDACVADGGCNRIARSDVGWGRGSRPVITVSWRDAKEYVKWLSRKTGEAYRLLSESEWEYVARAGTTTKLIISVRIFPRVKRIMIPAILGKR